jgi:hypothetical protein
MALNPVTIGLIWEAGRDLINRLFPDPVAQQKERAAAEYQLMQLTQSERMADKAQETELALGQISVNREEAKSDSLFKSGWRPAAGWAGVFGLVLSAMNPLINAVAISAGLPPIPPIDGDTLLSLLLGMLGLGTLRTYEKYKGVSNRSTDT